MVEGERRKRIADAYVSLPHYGQKTEQCIAFVKGTCRCRNIYHFLDSAKDSHVERLERMLFS